jgi:hypothetical protein
MALKSRLALHLNNQLATIKTLEKEYKMTVYDSTTTTTSSSTPMSRRTRNALLTAGGCLLLACLVCGGCGLTSYLIPWLQARAADTYVGIQAPIVVAPYTATPTMTPRPGVASPGLQPTPALVIPQSTAAPSVPLYSTTAPAAPAAPAAAATTAPAAPAPTAAPAPAVAPPQGIAQTTSPTSVHIYVVNPDAPDQIQVRHPVVYHQTQVSGTPISYQVEVPANYVMIVGGFKVDAVKDGVYLAKGPGAYTFAVTDGFVLLIRQMWSKDEWLFRLNQADQFGWAKQHIDAGPIQ